MYGKKKNKGAFSLIELLIAVTIFSIIASIIYSSFRLGVVAWKRTEANLSRYQKTRYALNVLSEDIANAFMLKGTPFKGEESYIEFVSFTKDKDTQERAVAKISYKFFNQKLLKNDAQLLTDVIDFKLYYCYKMPDEEITALQWLPSWISEDSIPVGVKLELALKDNSAPTGKRIFSKRIHVPSGEFGNIEEVEG